MARALLLLSLIASAACSTPPAPEPLDTWARMDVLTEVETPEPLPLPPSAKAVQGVTETGEPAVAYTLPEAEKLEARLTALNANSDMLGEAVEAVRALEAERRALVEAGRLTEQRANWLQAELAAETEAHTRERREHLVDNLLHRILFLIGIGVGL